ncbi:MAG: hypothetical protein GF401_12290 [Chitinivibrionales bacterium]|nr:hypothetical protein [Chitinivibrionales bacterium]
MAVPKTNSALSRYNCYLIAYILIVLTASVFAQSDQRCDLISKENISGEIQCIEPRNIAGDTIHIPPEITRISKNGLAICPRIFPQIVPADIVYIVDHSGSMKGNVNGIVIQDADTFYCADGCTNTQGTRTVVYEDGEIELPICGSCSKLSDAGDPLRQRANAIKTAIAKQKERAPTSTAGYIDFATTVISAIRPDSLSKQTHYDALMSDIAVKWDKDNQSTHYNYPLDSALKWLGDPFVAKTEKQVIVFLSDGEPKDTNDVGEYKSLLAPNPTRFVIYGIFLGYNDQKAGPLKELADTTGGHFYLVPPSRPDSLDGVIEEILREVLYNLTTDVTITNTTNNQTSNALNTISRKSGSSLVVELDSVIALESDRVNKIKVNLYHSSDDDENAYFYVVNDSDYQSKGSFAEYFAKECGASQIKFLDNSMEYIDTLRDDSLFYIELSTSAEGLKTFDPSIETRTGDDNETTRLHINDHALDPSSTPLVLQKQVSFAYEPSTDSNTTIEAARSDRVVVTWRHPRDPRDTAQAELIVKQSVITTYTPSHASLYDSDHDGRGDSLVIEYTISDSTKLPDIIEVDSAFWNRTEPDFVRINPTATMHSDSHSVSYDFSGNPFDENLTGPAGSSPPYAKISGGNLVLTTNNVLIQDKIGPVPIEAILYPSSKAGDDHDTLVVTISEPLDQTGIDQLIRIASSSNYDSSKSLQSAELISLSSDGFTYRILLPKDVDLSSESYVFLNSSGDFTDKAGNAPAEKGVELSVATHIYFVLPDTPDEPVSQISWSGPGNKEIIAVVKSETVNNSLDLIITCDNSDSEVYTLTREKGNKFTATLPFAFTKSPSSENTVIEGAIADPTGENSEILSATTIAPIDSTRIDTAFRELNIIYNPGPSIVKALYFPGQQPMAPVENPDHILIQFNEEVTWPYRKSATPTKVTDVFKIYTSKSDTIDSLNMEIRYPEGSDSAEYVWLIIPPDEIENVVITPGKDTIWLISNTPHLKDMQGAFPPGNLAPIQWGVELNWIPAVESPFAPDKPLPGNIKDILDDNPRYSSIRTGTFGQVISAKALQLDIHKTSVTIFDAVGNIVADKLPLVQDDNKDKYYFGWDGLNRNGRVVGSGTYVAAITVTDIDNNSTVQYLRVGVLH